MVTREPKVTREHVPEEVLRLPPAQRGLVEADPDELALLRNPSGNPQRRRRGPDDGLRPLIRKNVPTAQWTTVETGSTSGGVPDLEYCLPGGNQGWVECKATRAFAIKFRPGQPGWLLRRARMGGVCWIAVRRRNADIDELWVTLGKNVMAVAQSGLKAPVYWARWQGGPSHWDWDDFTRIISTRGWP